MLLLTKGFPHNSALSLFYRRMPTTTHPWIHWGAVYTARSITCGESTYAFLNGNMKTWVLLAFLLKWVRRYSLYWQGQRAITGILSLFSQKAMEIFLRTDSIILKGKWKWFLIRLSHIFGKIPVVSRSFSHGLLWPRFIKNLLH